MLSIMSHFNLRIITIASLIILLSCSKSESKEMSILNSKPLFSLAINASDVRAFIEVNGVYVHMVNSLSGSSSVEVPVNHYFHPEVNHLGIVVFPLAEGETRSANSMVNLTLSVKSDDKPDDQYDVAKIEYRASHDTPSDYNGNRRPVILSSADAFSEKGEGDVIVHPVVVDHSKGINISRKIEIPNSLPLWGFFKGDQLPDYFSVSKDDYAKDKDALYETYKIIEQSLSSGSVDGILDLFEERNRETDLAFYLESGETRESLKHSFLKSVNNEKLELLVSESKKFGLKPEPGRKLVRLIRADRRGPIAFNFIGEEGSVRYDLVFRKENGKWIIAR